MCARAHRDLVLHILNLCKIVGSFPLSPLFRVKRGKEGRSNRVIECILNEFLVATGRTLSNLRDVDIAVQPCAVKYLSRRDALTMTQCFLRLIKKPRVSTKSAHAAKKSGRGWSPFRTWPEFDWMIYFFFRECDDPSRKIDPSRISWTRKLNNFYKIKVPIWLQKFIYKYNILFPYFKNRHNKNKIKLFD